MSDNLVPVPREHIRPCDRCKSKLDMGILTRVTIDSLLLDNQSVRAVAAMEMHFGPGHERLASVMAPDIKATQGMREEKVLCFACTVAIMEHLGSPRKEVTA